MAVSEGGVSSAPHPVCKGSGQPAAQGAGLKSDICIQRHRNGHILVPAVSSCPTLRWHWRSENTCRGGQEVEQQEGNGFGTGVIMESMPHTESTKARANLQGKGGVSHQL